MAIITKHPEYNETLLDRWRLIEIGGDSFITANLKQRLNENQAAFDLRKELTWNPGHVSSSIHKVIRNITQRLIGEIVRTGGSEEYHNIVEGNLGGVDFQNTSMTDFITSQILPELLFLGKVGVYIDAPQIQGETKAATTQLDHPYLTVFTAEQIINWHYSNNRLESVLLKETYNVLTKEGLVKETKDRYRLISIVDGIVSVTFYNDKEEIIDPETNETPGVSILIDLPEIPFIIFELSQSLIKNIDKAEITLLNLDSADVSWIWKANLPIFTKQGSSFDNISRMYKVDEDEADTANAEYTESIKLGEEQGLSYAPGMDRPDFVAPPTAPSELSMSKQDQIKKVIESNLNTDLSRLKSSSAESKQKDVQGLESGLAAIGITLQHGENSIAKIFSLYENRDTAVIRYPEHYELLTDEKRIEKAQSLAKVQGRFPSKTAQQLLLIQQLEILLAHKTTPEEFKKIENEILEAPGLIADPEVLWELKERGLVSVRTASILLGYPPDEQAKAETEHRERLISIAKSQTEGIATGVEEKTISQSPEFNEDGKKKVRT